MSSGIWAAASGAVSQVANLDNASNNLANLETPGFHVDRLLFRRALTGSTPGQRAHSTLEYSVTRSASPDMRAGRIVPTERELDVAMPDDNAFFAIQTERGTRFTKAGNIQLMPDGVLATPTGEAYLGANMKPISVPLGTTNVRLSTTGEVIVNELPSGQRLQVVAFENPNALEKEGGVLFRAPAGAGVPSRIDTPYMQVGALEMQTDKAYKYMSAVVDASRTFGMMTEVIDAFRNIEQRAARDIAGK